MKAGLAIGYDKDASYIVQEFVGTIWLWKVQDSQQVAFFDRIADIFVESKPSSGVYGHHPLLECF